MYRLESCLSSGRAGWFIFVCSQSCVSFTVHEIPETSKHTVASRDVGVKYNGDFCIKQFNDSKLVFTDAFTFTLVHYLFTVVLHEQNTAF